MKRFGKWFLAVCVVLIAAVSVLAGCGAPPPSEDKFVTEDLAQPVNANIDKNVTANIKVGIRADEAEASILRGLIAGFNQEYPNVTVTLDRISSDTYETMLSAREPAGRMPDMFWINPTNLAYYYTNGMAFVLDNYIKQSGFDRSAYLDKAIDSGVSPKGHFYMMPRDYTQMVVYYNKAMFREAGITQIPGDDWTWEDFTALCGKFKEAGIVSDAYPVIDMELNWEAVYYPFIRSFGGEVVDEEGNVVLDKGLDEDPSTNGAYRYLGTLLELKRDKYILGTQSGTAAGQSFYGGFSPFYFHSRLTLTQGYEALGEDLGVLPFPATGETPYMSAGATGLGIYRKSPNRDVAWAFLQYMMSAAGQNALMQTGNIIPTLLSEREAATWKQYPQGASLDHDKFLVNEERGISPEFLSRMPPETHLTAFMHLRGMYTKVLYEQQNRVSAIRLTADSMYNLMAYGV